MSLSSQPEPKAEFSEGGTAPNNAGLSLGAKPIYSPTLVNTQAINSSYTSSFEPPNFGSLAKIYAATYRRAERINAANISDQEHTDFLEERQVLISKELDGSITPKETHRLEYVRWTLDRIEDAKYGDALDILDEYVSRYERFGMGVENLTTQLMNHTASGRKVLRKNSDRK